MSKNGKLVDVAENVEMEEIVKPVINGLNQDKMVFLGEIQNFTLKGEIDIDGSNVKLNFRRLKSRLDNTRKWKYSIDEFTFMGYSGIDQNEGTIDIYENGEIFISHLGYKSLERLATAKKWNVSQLHKDYKITVGRELETSSSVPLKGKM